MPSTTDLFNLKREGLIAAAQFYKNNNTFNSKPVEKELMLPPEDSELSEKEQVMIANGISKDGYWRSVNDGTLPKLTDQRH
jgi:hypothetical protein